MSITSITGISQNQSLPTIQQTKPSAVFSLANRIRDFFKNKIFPFFNRFFDIVTSPLRRRKVCVHKAPLPKGPNAVAKKAEELLPPTPKVPLAVEPKSLQLPPVPPVPSVSSPAPPPSPVIVRPVIQAQVQPAQLIPAPVAIQVPVIPQQTAPDSPPSLPAQQVPQLPAQPIVSVQVNPFSITADMRKLTDSILAVLQNQEAMLTKFKSAWFPPVQKDIFPLHGWYKQIRDEGRMLAQQLSSHAQQHQDISKLVEKLKDLSGKAQLGMDELDPIVKNGVISGGITKLLAGSSKAQELQRGFDFCNEWRKTIQTVLNLPNTQHKA
ncbi:MAG: hypothetical protein LLG04_01105 [Parachlamydia sp.]|nr:hypothetical protein [Parachlamydia sp.]